MAIDYSGMTVKERLEVSGLSDEYDNAVTNKDSLKIQTILKKVLLDDESIREILKHKDLDAT